MIAKARGSNATSAALEKRLQLFLQGNPKSQSRRGRASKVLVFEGGYHGRTLSLGRPNDFVLPHQFALGIYNDIERTRAVLDSQVGVILIEPIQGASGLIPATREFLTFLQEEAARVGAVLLFDETVTARTNYGGLRKHHNIVPDMTTLGKFFGGAFAFVEYGGHLI